MSEALARRYNVIAASTVSTVVAEYIPEPKAEAAYQTEAELERELIRLLESQAYEYLPVTSEEQLIQNLRTQLEALNQVTFTDCEWEGFFGNVIAGANVGIVEKTTRIQEDHVQLLKRDDGSVKNITLLDKENIHNNRLQVINQYQIGRADPGDRSGVGGRYANRYDVTVLVNGLPMVHIELKRRGVDIREAFNQIDRYQRESFWAGSGLFEYVQLFVISNGTLTKYYSNTTRSQHVSEQAGAKRRRVTSHSFEFTSWWADARNKPVQDLTSFTKTFFAKHTLLNILTKYCVLTVDGMLLVMRPYQIVATERILQLIDIATNYKRLGTVAAGGYVWHTTGSGKTLTSFKTAQLAQALPSVDKVLFVVDRKDLDYQTMREYDRFQKGAANSNRSTAMLKEQLEDPSVRIIITTIQKLSMFVKANRAHEVYGRHVVIIFDECHRSQFGDMHTAITKAFTRYNLFGFTGTPIFVENSGSGGNPRLKTTEQAFGERLHTYTIVDAITDKNVLPFKIDYVNAVKVPAVTDTTVSVADTENALLDPKRVGEIVKYTLEHFDQKTKRATSYELSVVTNVAEVARTRVEALRERKRVQGFNAMFATASIEAACRYYRAFQIQQEQLPQGRRLKIALIYSYGANDAVEDGGLYEEGFDTDWLSVDAREFLGGAIQDYNELFGTSFDTSADLFQSYYEDLSRRIRNREVDLVIVVNMFLTGFDATTLNTLFVDKSVRAHGLIQAFSRTNRVLNSVKTHGNIVSFRDLSEETDAALELFGDKDAGGVVLLRPYGEYYGEYAVKVAELLSVFPLGERIVGEAAQKDFVRLFGAVLRLENILTSFDDFAGAERLTERQRQDYRSVYLDLYGVFRREKSAERAPVDDDVVFEIELMKQVEVNVDYILGLVARDRGRLGVGVGEGVRSEMSRVVDASPTLRGRRDLFEGFVEVVSAGGVVGEQWEAFIAARREAELAVIIEEEGLRADAARAFVEAGFRDGVLRVSGTAVMGVLPPVSRFSVDGGYVVKKRRVVERLDAFFERFNGLSTGSSD